MRGKSAAVVTIGGWVFILSSLIALFQLRRFHPGGNAWVSMLGLVLYMGLGVGLLLRRNWARWLTLGISLLAWTVGSLVGLWLVAKLFRAFAQASAFSGLFILLGLVVVAIFVAIIVLNYRLFDHLTSPEGRAEFDTPDTERNAVAKSTAAYLAWCVLAAILGQPGLFRSTHSPQAESLALRESPERPVSALAGPARQTQQPLANDNPASQGSATAEDEALERREAAEALLRQAERREVEMRQQAADEIRTSARQDFNRKTRALFDRRVRDRSYTEAQFAADQQQLQRELERAYTSRPGAPSGSGAAPETGSDRSPATILKCRDASGAVSFTQGYCPAGTTLVESKRQE